MSLGAIQAGVPFELGTDASDNAVAAVLSEGGRPVACHTCSEVKPQFFKPASQTLIKAVRPWDRISIDFKGRVSGPHPYLLIVVDEHSRFPFVFPCKNMKSSTVTLCLSSLFCLFGFPGCVHSDRGAPFIS